MEDFIPAQPPNSVRIVIELYRSEKRMDTILLNAIKAQAKNLNLREVTRSELKNLFLTGRIQIKGQRARPSSGLAKGTTYVDVIGFNP